MPSRKAVALLVYLMSTGRPYSREVLADFFWDDRPQDQAAANLRSLLSGLRRQFKPFLTITRQSVAINEDADIWLDIHRFNELGSSETIADLKEAIELYQADFLAGFDVRDSRGFEEWVLLERERLQRTAVHALRQLITHHQQQGEYKQGIDYAARLLALSPLSEWAHRQMMIMLARNEERAAALQQYQLCCDILDEELGIDPSPDTTTLYEQIRAVTESQRHSLPPDNTPFVGRAAELAQISARLTAPDCRLLTLVGPGGTGKTRLALAAARSRPGAFLNGAAFIPLAGTASPDSLVSAIADGLEFSFSGNTPPQTQLIDYLTAKELLLVLDNYEHLLPELDLVITLLQEAPGLKILVTSRARLNLQMEWALDITGLQLPGEDAADPLTTDALQLFLQAARRVQAHFSLQKTDLESAVRICRLVEGLPLGIELAASWIRQLTTQEIAQEIARGLSFLQSRAGDIPQRHRSLQAVFDHSWNLLTADEQTVLERLSVFRGGFRRDAAEHIAGASFWTLSALVDKSLVVRHNDGRYTFHESIRLFAAEKLARRQKDGHQTYAGHAAYFADLLHRHQYYWLSPRRQAALTQLLPETENINAAWEWATRHHAHHLLEKALISLYFLYEIRGQYQEGSAAFGWAMAAMLEKDAAAAQSDLYARLALRYGKFQLLTGQREQAQKLLQTVALILDGQETTSDLVDCLNHLAISHSFSGEFAEAMEYVSRALTLVESSPKPLLIAFSLNLRGTIRQRTGDYSGAADDYGASLALRQEHGDQYGAAVVLNNMGNLAIARSQHAEAKQFYAQSVEIFEAINHTPGRAAALANTGVAALRSGDLIAARNLLEESLLLKQNLGNQRSIAITLINLGELEIALEEFAPARRHLLDALRRTLHLRIYPLLLEAVLDLALIRAAEKDLDKAVSLLVMVQHHEATTSETREKATAQLAELGDAVTPARIAGGKELHWETAVQELLSGV